MCSQYTKKYKCTQSKHDFNVRNKTIYTFRLMTAAIIKVITKTQNDMRKVELMVRDREPNTPSVMQYTYLLTPWNKSPS